MCLGIPGCVIEIVDAANHIVKVDVAGVKRNISAAVLEQENDAVVPGDWVLIHVGFAMAKIDEKEAAATYAFLEGLGQAYEDELAILEESDLG